MTFPGVMKGRGGGGHFGLLHRIAKMLNKINNVNNNN